MAQDHGQVNQGQNVQGKDKELMFGQNLQGQQQEEWPAWPEELPAAGQAMGAQINLNLAPVIVEQDLNEFSMGDDLQEMIVHPA